MIAWVCKPLFCVVDCSDNRRGASNSFITSPSFSNTKEGLEMANFHDALDEFGKAFELDPEIKTGLTAAYDMDFNGFDDKVHGLEGQIAAKDTELNETKQEYETRISAIKAANYDLLRGAGNSPTSSSSAGNQTNDNPDDNEDYDETITVNDLFRPKTR